MPGIHARGILFDKDGTLFDFQATWGRIIRQLLDELSPDRASWERMAAVGGYDPTADRFTPGGPLVAAANSEIGVLWEPFRPDLGAQGIERRLDEVAADALTRPDFLCPAVPDLPGLLAGLRGAGYTLGVATHDSEHSARLQLGAAGVLAPFAFIAGYDSGHGLKPRPGMLLAFAAAVGIDPAEVIMVGDSTHDLQVARNGGAAMAVGVLTGPASEADLAPFADHVLPSIAALPALLERLAG